MLLTEAYANDFSYELNNRLSAEILLATETFNRFSFENRHYFSHPNHTAILSRLLHCGIEKSLCDLAFHPDSLYQCTLKSVNNFGYTINEMKTENFIFTSSKTFKGGELPVKSKYKVTYAQANSGADGQLYFDFSSEPTIVVPPFYAILTYGYNKLSKECSHITMIVPDKDFNHVILSNPLPANKSIIDVIPVSEQEETIVRLNSEFENMIKLKEITNK